MNTIQIEYDNKLFIFKTEEDVRDKIKIEVEATKLVGDRLILADLQTSLDMAKQKLIDFNVQKFGKEDYEKKQNRIKELSEKDEFNEEYLQLFDELNNNPLFQTFLNLQNEMDNIYGYARLKVMCTKAPDKFDFFGQKPEYLQEILKKLEKEKIFFRR